MQTVNKNSMEFKDVTRNKGGGGESKNDSVENMLDFNALTYDMYPDLSVAVDRTLKTSYPQKSSYNFGDTIQININSGSDFINGRTSYLSFDLTMSGTSNTDVESRVTGTEGTDPAFYSWGAAGSAYNVIKDILITDRSGNEIERIKDVSYIANHLIRATRTSDFLYKNGTTIQVDHSKTDKPWLVSPTKPTRWILPLRHLSGLFDYDQLLPSQLMSGLRIELTLEQTHNAVRRMYGSDTNNPVLTLENPRLMLDSVKLTDSIMRELNRRAAKTGLEIMFRTWHMDTSNISTSTVNFESRKAVSRAFGAIAKISLSENVSAAAELLLDSQASVSAPWTEYQWRAGNLYFPNQKLKGTKKQLAMETFNQVQSFYHKDSTNQQDNDLSFTDFYYDDTTIEGNGSGGTFGTVVFGSIYKQPGSNKQGVLTVDLERTTVQDLSGIPLNNSRVLALQGEVDSPGAWKMRVFLNYLKVARVFMENTEIEE